MRSMARRIGCLVIGVGMSACGGAQPAAGGGQCGSLTTTGDVVAMEVCPGTNGRILDPTQGNTEIGTFVVSESGYETIVLPKAPALTTTAVHPFPPGGMTLAAPLSASEPPRAIRSVGTRFKDGVLGSTAKAKAVFQVVDRAASGSQTVVGFIASVRSAAEGEFLVTFYAHTEFVAVNCLAAPAAGLTRHWIPVDPAVDQNVSGMRVSSPATFTTK